MMRRYLTNAAIATLSLLLSVEVGSAIYLVFFEKFYFYRPAWTELFSAEENQYYWRTEASRWGAWHRSNGAARHKGNCYDVEYRSNSVGARDKERQSSNSKRPRFVVLGDSYVEGYAVDALKRFSDVLEETTGYEFLNFGAGGDFGPVQYLLLYSDLAKKFDHDFVIVGMFPYNDFTDNDPDFWRHDPNFARRYRPYARKVGTQFEVFYPVEKPTQDAVVDFLSGLTTWQEMSRYFWTTGAFVAMQRRLAPPKGYYDRLGYFERDPQRFERVRTFLGKLQKEALGKPLILVSIPMYQEVQHARHKGFEDFVQYAKFLGSLEREGAIVIDLLQDFAMLSPATINRLYLACDGHWSKEGHELAAMVIGRTIRGLVPDGKRDVPGKP